MANKRENHTDYFAEAQNYLAKQGILTYDELPNAQRNYKDTVFRMIFRKKMALLSLYNAVNKTNFTNAEDLEITTLENAVYLGMKNDISCVFDFELSLFEHQSTVNPNMPLRNLFYVTQQLQKIVSEDNMCNLLQKSEKTVKPWILKLRLIRQLTLVSVKEFSLIF